MVSMLFVALTHMKIEFEFNPFKINKDKPLHKLGAFWYPIILFVGFGVYLSIPFWCLCIPEPSNYEVLAKQLSFPLLISSFALPITVSIARFHSSKISTESNRISEQNLSFNHYFDHRKHFETHVSNVLGTNNWFKLDDISKLYQLYFPENSMFQSNYELNKEEFYQELRRRKILFHRYIAEALLLIRDEVESEEVENNNLLDKISKASFSFGIILDQSVLSDEVFYSEAIEPFQKIQGQLSNILLEITKFNSSISRTLFEQRMFSIRSEVRANPSRPFVHIHDEEFYEGVLRSYIGRIRTPY